MATKKRRSLVGRINEEIEEFNEINNELFGKDGNDVELSEADRRLYSEITRLKDLLESKDTEINELKSNNKLLTQQNDKLTNIKSDLTNQISTLRNKSQESTDILKDKEQIITNLQTELDAACEKNQENEKVIASLTTRINEITQLLDDKQNQIDALDSELESASSPNKKLSEELSALNQENRQLVDQMAKLESELGEVQSHPITIPEFDFDMFKKMMKEKSTYHAKGMVTHHLAEFVFHEFRKFQTEFTLSAGTRKFNDLYIWNISILLLCSLYQKLKTNQELLERIAQHSDAGDIAVELYSALLAIAKAESIIDMK